MARMALSLEGFRQDVREANENRLQSGCECGTFVGRVPTGRQRSHKNRLQSGCALGHFVERGVGSHVVKLNIFVGRAPTRCPNTGKQASYAGIDT